MNNTKLRITELDFDSIRTNLKSFLKDQTEFTDYDFDGSGISVLLDVLAYNTHYNSYYLNMVANEMFLDSAAERDSVVAIAKHFGYVTKSSAASSATVTLTISATEATTNDCPGSIEIPEHTKFTSTIDGTNYVFHTLESYLVTVQAHGSDTGPGPIVRTFTLPDVKIYEGRMGTITFVVSESGFEQRYIIPSKNIDTTSLRVRVQDSATDTTKDIYTLYDGLSTLSDTSKIYFLQEVDGEQYEVSFGDGILGSKVTEGNIITVDYLKTSGDVPNGAGSSDSSSARTFSISSPLSYDGQTTAPTTVAAVTSVASGGITKPESLESIKFNTPKSFQSQNRAVTKSDYESIVLSKYPNAASTIVWGGEDNKPVPDNGSVYISIRPVSGLVLNEVQKSDLKSILDKYKVLAITPKVVDPDYIFIKVTSTITYDQGSAVNPRETIRDAVTTTIKNYNNTYLSEFYKPFRYSKMISLIDETDDSIISSVTDVSLKRRIKISKSQLGTGVKDITLLFNNAIVQNNKLGLSVGKFKSDPFFDSRAGSTTTVVAGTSITTYDENSLEKVYIADDTEYGLNLLKVVDNSIYNPPFRYTGVSDTTSPSVADGDYGKINYDTGKVTIDTLEVESLIEDPEYLYFYADIIESDVRPDFNQIITILDDDINVVVKTEEEVKKAAETVSH